MNEVMKNDIGLILKEYIYVNIVEKIRSDLGF